MPLFHLAALFTLQQGAKLGVPSNQLTEALPRLAGAAYVRLALSGRCVVGRGTQAQQLWTEIKSGFGKSVIEEQLPLNGATTKRFAFFSDRGVNFYDTIDLQQTEFEHSPAFIDSWGIARRITKGVPGTLFWTDGGAA